MRIDRSKHGTGEGLRAKLTADMIETDTVVLTIESARSMPGADRHFIVLRFAEFPEHDMPLNKSQEDALIELIDNGAISDDTDDWQGEKIPFYKRINTNPETGDKVAKLYAAPVDEFVSGLKTWGKKGAKAKFLNKPIELRGGKAKPKAKAAAPAKRRRAK